MHKAGKHIPAIENRPNVGPWGYFYKAFIDLTTCRAWGDIPGPIPWTAINDYATRHYLNNKDFADLKTVVSALDNAYLNAWHNKRRQEIAQNGRSTKTNSNSRRL